MKQALAKVFAGESLSVQEARRAMELLISGQALPEQAAAFLGALRAKKETRDEIAGFVVAMREKMILVPVERSDVMDTCGTGGSGTDAFNISTAVAFIVAASGTGVAKHGNRSISSRCGSADVLEALGVPIDLPPERAARAIDQLGIAFLFAPAYHPALKHVGPVRKAIGVRTILNILGPLVNPARVSRQVIGVPDATLVRVLAEVLGALGSTEVMVVSGSDGLDEITLSGPTYVAHLRDGEVSRYSVAPEDLGLARASLEEVRGGDARENAAILEGVLKGRIRGPKRDIVLLNAAASLWVAGKAGDLREGAELAGQLIDSGRAMDRLEKLRGFSE